jgi:hypothetical protein
MSAVGLVSRGETGLGSWTLTAAIMGPLILLSAGSAAASLLIARRGRQSALSDGESMDAIAAGDTEISQKSRDYSSVSRR